MELSVEYRFVAPCGTKSVEATPDEAIDNFPLEGVKVMLFPCARTLETELSVVYRFVAPGETRSAELMALLICKLPPDEVRVTLFPAESRLLTELIVAYMFVAPWGTKSAEATLPPPPVEAISNFPLEGVKVMLF